ncbi:MAG: right-handed parallel beta-helix repeat-containing protein [Thermoplasmata archaeon]|nr:MAG: right-handed parallel beta-helix repeat-containing protein [Thermoplasmata archaeon]
MRRIKAVSVAMIILMGSFVFLDIASDITTINADADTLYVGFGFGNDSTTIQGAIDLAGPGDTIFVYSGVYYESVDPTTAVKINKTVTLIGEDKDTTVIDINSKTYGVHLVNVDYVNISGFTVTNANGYNILLTASNNSHIYDNILKNAGGSALGIFPGSGNLIENNLFSDNLKGIFISSDIVGNFLSNSNILRYNSIISCEDRAISIQSQAHDNLVHDNTISGYEYGSGIYIYESESNRIENNQISNGENGINVFVVDDLFLSDNVISDNNYGLKVSSASMVVENCSISNSASDDVWINDPDSLNPEITLINTTFDAAKVSLLGDGSTLTVKWYLHVKVINEYSLPVGGIKIYVEDNPNGSLNETFTTNSEGEVNWILLTQYIQTQTSTVFYTPHNVTAYNLTHTGYTSPEIIVDKNKDTTIMVSSIYNHLPNIVVIEPTIDDPTTKEGTSLKFSIEASDPDPLDTLVITWYIDDAVVQNGGRSFTYYPDFTAAGEHVVKVDVNDGTDSVDHIWNLTVEDVGINLTGEGPPAFKSSLDDPEFLLFLVVMMAIVIIIIIILAFLILKKKKKPENLEHQKKDKR